MGRKRNVRRMRFPKIQVKVDDVKEGEVNEKPEDVVVDPNIEKRASEKFRRLLAEAVKLTDMEIKKKEYDMKGNTVLYDMISNTEKLVINICEHLHQSQKEPIAAIYKRYKGKRLNQHGLNTYGKFFVMLEQRFKGIYNTISCLVNAVNGKSNYGVTYYLVAGAKKIPMKRLRKIKLLKARRVVIQPDHSDLFRKRGKYVIQIRLAETTRRLQNIGKKRDQVYPEIKKAVREEEKPTSSNYADLTLALSDDLRRPVEISPSMRRRLQDLQAFHSFRFTLNSDHLTDMQIRGLFSLNILSTEVNCEYCDEIQECKGYSIV